MSLSLQHGYPYLNSILNSREIHHHLGIHTFESPVDASQILREDIHSSDLIAGSIDTVVEGLIVQQPQIQNVDLYFCLAEGLLNAKGFHNLFLGINYNFMRREEVIDIRGFLPTDIPNSAHPKRIILKLPSIIQADLFIERFGLGVKNSEINYFIPAYSGILHILTNMPQEAGKDGISSNSSGKESGNGQTLSLEWVLDECSKLGNIHISGREKEYMEFINRNLQQSSHSEVFDETTGAIKKGYLAKLSERILLLSYLLGEIPIITPSGGIRIGRKKDGTPRALKKRYMGITLLSPESIKFHRTTQLFELYNKHQDREKWHDLVNEVGKDPLIIEYFGRAISEANLYAGGVPQFGNDPLEYYYQYHRGLTRGQLRAKHPTLYERLRIDRLLNQVPSSPKHRRIQDTIAFYKQNYSGLTRGQLQKVDESFYRKMRSEGLLDHVPLKYKKSN